MNRPEHVPVEATSEEVITKSKEMELIPPKSNGDVSFIAGAIMVAGLMVSGTIFYMGLNPVGYDDTVMYIPTDIEQSESDVSEWSLPEDSGNDEIVGGSDPVALAEDPTDYSVYYKKLVNQEGVVWLPKPLPLGDLKLIAHPVDAWFNQSPYTWRYYQIGSMDGQPITYLEIPVDGMGVDTQYLFFVGTESGSARQLVRPSNYDLVAQFKNDKITLAAGVTSDTQTTLNALTLDSVQYKGVLLNSGRSLFWGDAKFGGFFANTEYNLGNRAGNMDSIVDFMADTPYGPLFRVYRKSDQGTASYEFAIRTAGGLYAPFRYKIPYITDDRVPQITWNDGNKNLTMYRSDGLGSCGGGGPEIALTRVPDIDTTVVGTTITGEVVKSIINPKHPLVTRVMEATGGQVYDYNTASGQSSTYVITPEQFVANRGVILIENPWGEQNIFTHGTYGPQAECGKPVIYLYPQATTTITVAVDALVTKSEPLYKNGWTVVAAPTGQLLHEGKTYGSLFWDGYGNGPYPKLTQGYVVKTGDALALMSQHLRQMNFNDTEISEFNDFWVAHLPPEPYTQFSWLQTTDMQIMAPLRISPKPQTLIRAFVDFKGLMEPISIEPQQLESKKRNGYTVTEWGGVLRR